MKWNGQHVVQNHTYLNPEVSSLQDAFHSAYNILFVRMAQLTKWNASKSRNDEDEGSRSKLDGNDDIESNK